MLMILDSESYNLVRPRSVEDYTLGEAQRYDIKKVLEETAGVRYKLFFTHRLIGGMPGGPSGNLNEDAYARGPLATEEDYYELNRKFGKEIGYEIDPKNVEQIWLTNLLLKYRIDVLAMGHDHIFNNRVVEKSDKKLNLICTGSPKHKGELRWWDGEHSLLWKHFYGDFGGYGNEAETRPPDFWGSSGYTKLSITKHGINVKYIRSAYNHPFTNISPSKSVGEILYGTRYQKR